MADVALHTVLVVFNWQPYWQLNILLAVSRAEMSISPAQRPCSAFNLVIRLEACITQHAFTCWGIHYLCNLLPKPIEIGLRSIMVG